MDILSNYIKSTAGYVEKIKNQEKILSDLRDEIDSSINKDLVNLLIINTLTKEIPNIDVVLERSGFSYVKIEIEMNFNFEGINFEDCYDAFSIKKLMDKTVGEILNKEYYSNYREFSFSLNDYYCIANKFGINIDSNLKESVKKYREVLVNTLMGLNNGIVEISDILNKMENE